MRPSLQPLNCFGLGIYKKSMALLLWLEACLGYVALQARGPQVPGDNVDYFNLDLIYVGILLPFGNHVRPTAS